MSMRRARMVCRRVPEVNVQRPHGVGIMFDVNVNCGSSYIRLRSMTTIVSPRLRVEDTIETGSGQLVNISLRFRNILP